MGGARLLASPRDGNNEKADGGGDSDAHVRERDLVESYVQEHALEETLNDVVNQIVADRPEDPFLVLSSLLYGKATAKRGIFHVECKEILDGLGLPGVLVRVHTGKGVFDATCSSFVDGKPDRPESLDEFAPTIPLDKQRFGGRGYKRRVEQAQLLLIEALVNLEPTDQQAVDSALILTEQEIGRNLTIAASIAVCKAGARYAERPLHEHIASLLELPLENICLPLPLFSLINAGTLASNKLFIQEIFAAPVSATSFSDAFQLGVELHRSLRNQLDARGIGFSNLGAFGGFAPQLQTVAETFQILRSAMDETRARLEASGGPASWLLDSASVTPLRFEFGIDFAASSFVTPPPPSVTPGSPSGDDRGEEDEEEPLRTVFTYDTDKWVPGSSGVVKSSDEMLEMIQSCVKELGIASVVDPFDRGDIKAFAALLSGEHDVPSDSSEGLSRRLLGGDPECRLQVIGRDLLDVHGLEAIQDERAANTVLLQLDQFATVSRLLASITDARRFGFAVMLGATTAQSSDASFLAALAIGAGIGQVKFGGLGATECVDRYNELLLAAEGAVPPAFVGGAYRR
jgi:enolase